jgi:RimJ/RimL family protein N-acetyltransferase
VETAKFRFEELSSRDLDALARWFPQQTWPFHGRSRVDEAWVRERAAEGFFWGDDARAFWIFGEGSEPLGVIRVFELVDTTPLVDLRIADSARRHGVGTAALDWITSFIFEHYPAIHRLGGYTRKDNLGMLKLFERCGFTREAVHREAWRLEDGGFTDAVGYAIIRPRASESN